MAYSLSHRVYRSIIRGFGIVIKSVSIKFYFKLVTSAYAALDLTYVVRTKKGPINIIVGSDTARIRASRMLVREPDTLNWIEGFESGDVFWDVGSNIGVFSLYAARVCNAQVVAFDPLPWNYAALMKNIEANNLHNKIMAFCLAVTDEPRIDKLYMSSEAMTEGGATCPFGEDSSNYKNVDTVKPVYTSTALGMSLDNMASNLAAPFPNHLKIDIDGHEQPVITGAMNILQDERLKSVMFEINGDKNTHDLVVKQLADAGLILIKTEWPGGAGQSNHRPDVDKDTTNNFFERVRPGE